jgi:RNA polymerase sigma-70 factor (ECF subfamily)
LSQRSNSADTAEYREAPNVVAGERVGTGNAGDENLSAESALPGFATAPWSWHHSPRNHVTNRHPDQYVQSMDRWTELALGAQRGNQDDLGLLVDTAYGPTHRLCGSLVDLQSANDLAQETFLRVARGIRSYRGDSSAKTWLFSIAYHVCSSELRSRVRRRDHTDPRGDLLLSQLQARDDRTDQLAVDDLLRRLEPDRRAAFTLTQLYGLSYEETAAICGCAPGTVASRVARARGDLIGLLGADDRTDDPGDDRPVTSPAFRPIGGSGTS